MRMSSAAKKGGKPSNPLSKDTSVSGKMANSKNADSTKPDQINPKLQPTAEQLRIAQMISDSKRDDPDLPEKVSKLVELTNCSADAAIIALHDSNNDLDHAIAALLDGEPEGDWEVSGRKKKPKQPVQPQPVIEDIARGGRPRRGGPPRLRGRGRGRENKENLEDDERGRGGRGARNGRGGRGGRGRRGTRGGAAPSSDNTWEEGTEPVEPWANDFPSAEDWDNEEYIGSLVETKVFTPSTAVAPVTPVVPETNGSEAAQQGIDLNALLQKGPQQQFLQYNHEATDALKAVMGVGAAKKTLRAKIPPPSKIPSSAVEMPDDPIVSGLDVKFGTLDFGIEPSGFEMDLPVSTKQELAPDYAPPAASSLPKPDSSLGGFTATPSTVKSTHNSPASYPYGTSYAPPQASQASSSTSHQQPAGAYPSSSSQSSAGIYSSGGSASSSAYQQQGVGSQTAYGSYGQQQQNYQTYNNKPSSGVNDNLRDNTTTASRPVTSATTKPTASLPNMPPGVPVIGPGSFIMGQSLPYYAAAAAPGMQQHPVYSLEDVQYRYPHLAAAGYYDMGYQSPTSLGTGREPNLTSLAYAGNDAKFSRNENNSPVPTSLSQNAAQSHGGAFITPAAAAPAPLTPAYAYYYSGGVMPGGYQFGAPAALYPVSAAAQSGPTGGVNTQYVKGASSQQQVPAQPAGTGGGGASGYASYGSTYEDFSKSVYNSVGGNAGNQASKISSTASASADLGPTVYGKSQLGKINTYDKSGGFHTGTPPPYGLTGNANAAPLGGPSPYGAQHMFIPALPHQSQHSHLMHQQLHQDSSSGQGQRSQQSGQQNKQGSKPSYGGSYWGSN